MIAENLISLCRLCDHGTSFNYSGHDGEQIKSDFDRGIKMAYEFLTYKTEIMIFSHYEISDLI